MTVTTPTVRLNQDGSPTAYPGEFLRCVIGSTIHGLHVAGTDDLDLMGVMIEPLRKGIGFEEPLTHYTFRTQPEEVPSGPGDVDCTVYSLRKYLRLAAKGNPTVLNLLFVAPKDRRLDSTLGDQLRDQAPNIVSREAAFRYQHYLQNQRERMLGLRGQKHTGKTRRKKYLTATAGEEPWDGKFALHMIRVGVQGVELMQTGRIELPMKDPIRQKVLDIRLGKVALAECIQWAELLEAQLEWLGVHADLRPEPNRAALEAWMVNTYLEEWRTT